MSVVFVQTQEEAQVVTHGGSYHADEIFGISIFEVLFDDVNVYRIPLNRDEKTILPGKIWFDVGGGEFDHHQRNGNGFHKLVVPGKNPIPYASFGLLWRRYGFDVCRKVLDSLGINSDERLISFSKEYVNKMLVKGIDAADNGIFPKNGEEGTLRVPSLSFAVSLLNEEDVPDDKNESLKLVVSLARVSLLTTINRAYNTYIGKVLQTYRDFEYMDRIYQITMRKLRLYPKFIKNMGKQTFYSNSPLFQLWSQSIDEYALSIEGDRQVAIKTMSDFIEGICADERGIILKADDSMDEVNYLTLGDVFGDISTFVGADYNELLENVYGKICENMVESAKERATSAEYVQQRIKEVTGPVLVLEKRAYWHESMLSSSAQNINFVISPTRTGMWKVNPVRCKTGYRKAFPSEWLGLRGEELSEKVKMDGVVFVHQSGYFALCENIDVAHQLCNLAVSA